MLRSAAARRLARLVGSRRPRLRFEALEDRAVPANSLSIADHATPDANINVSTVGNTTTISTTDASAQLSLTTLETALLNPSVTNVIVTTAVVGPDDADEVGDIEWDETQLLEALDFTNFGTGKTLTFRTVTGTNALGNINLTGVTFLNAGGDDQVNLVFDSSGPGGNVSFVADGFGSNSVTYSAEAVNNLTVTAGAGNFAFADDGFNISAADAGGAVSINAAAVDITHGSGLTAGAGMSVSGTDVTLGFGTGLLAVGDLTLTGTTSVTADTAGLESEAGALTVTAPDVTLTNMVVLAAGTVKVAGSTSVTLTTPAADTVTSENGNVEISGGQVNLPFTTLFALDGQVTITGTTVDGWLGVEAGHTAITATTSVALPNSTVHVGGATVQAPTVDLTNAVFFPDTGDVSISGTTVNLDHAAIDVQDGKVTITAPGGIFMDDTSIGSPGDQTITGPVTLGVDGAEFVSGGRNAAVTFTGSIDGVTAGTAVLILDARSFSFAQNVGGSVGLNSLILNHGTARFAGNLTAATVLVGHPTDPNDTDATEAVLATGGIVTGNVTVGEQGTLAPGGLGTVGTMEVRGNVTFEFLVTNPGGDLAIDFGPGGTADQLRVVNNPATPATEGNVDLTDGAMLGGRFGSGQMTGPNAAIITYTGALSGEFTNAPLTVPPTAVLLGTDAITVTAYDAPAGPAGQAVVVAPMPADADGVVVGTDRDDATGFKARLTGGGQLVHGADYLGYQFLVVRNSTPVSKLTVTTTANASDDVVTFGAGVLINGPLAAYVGAKTNIKGQFRATGLVKAATFRDLLEADNAGGAVIAFGGTSLERTAITARDLFGSVTTGSTLTSLRARTLGVRVDTPVFPNSVLTAPTAGTVTAKVARTDLNVGGRLTSLNIPDYMGDVKAGTVGTFTVGDWTGDLTATGTVDSIKATKRIFADIEAGAVTRFDAFGGSASIQTTGAVGTVTSRGPNGIELDVTATQVKSVVVTSELAGTGTPWEVTNGITTLTAGRIAGVELEARYLGVVLVKGYLAEALPGDIADSTFTLTGNDGTAAQNGIRSLTAQGAVDASIFHVRAGNVPVFTVGRFHDSGLYLNYTPHDPFTTTFDLGGAFGPTAFRLGAFKTTAVPTADPDSPQRWAFQNSEIAAGTIGTVTLSGLKTDNGGVAFGIKVQSPGAVVKVTRADNLPPNSVLTASDFPIEGDFFFIDE